DLPALEGPTVTGSGRMMAGSSPSPGNPDMERLSRRALFSLAGGCLTLVVGGNLAGEARAAATVVDVARSPSCGCCGAWIEHIRAAGFTVQDRLVEDLAPLKAQLGVPAALQSC